MKIQPVVSVNDLYDFFYYNEFSKEEQQAIKFYGVDNVVDILLENNKILYSLYGFNFLFLAVRDDNVKPTGLLFSTFINNGVVETGSYKTIDENNRIFITRVFVWYLKYVNAINGIVRKQAAILENNIGSLNIHKKMGYVVEGLLHKYDGVNNYYMVAKYE